MGVFRDLELRVYPLNLMQFILPEGKVQLLYDLSQIYPRVFTFNNL